MMKLRFLKINHQGLVKINHPDKKLFYLPPSAGRHLQCRPMFAKITKVKKSKILANKRSGLQNPTRIRFDLKKLIIIKPKTKK